MLEPKVFAVLAHLIARHGELVTRNELLDSIWGHRYVTPSTLNRVITLARRALQDDTQRRKLIQTVHRSGYRYTGPVERSSSKVSEAHVAFAPPPSARLPACLNILIGRDHELEQIDLQLTGSRSLTILGTGGMGKTQCALAYAHARRDHYPDGIWFFDLAPARSADEWLQSLAQSLGVARSLGPELLDTITDSLANRRALLLLDNCDRVSTQVGALVIQILKGTEHLKILATSQHCLSFLSERVMRMPPLALPTLDNPASDEALQEIATAAAVELLLARIRDTQPDFELTRANAPAIVGICVRLDGMPLGLELAAARFALLSPNQVLDRLDHRFRFLVSDVAGRDPRHQNLIALLEWSFALLSAEEQRLLSWLGVFVQGWTVDAVIDLAMAFETPGEVAVDLLSGLVNKSLVSTDQSFSPPRYRLLESVREFALEQLKGLGEERRARDAHLGYIVRLTATAHESMLGNRMRETIAEIVPEHGNIDSACEYAVGPGNNATAALAIAGCMAIYSKAHGAIQFASRLCEQSLRAAPMVRSRERALALLCRGINLLFGSKTGGDQAFLEAINIAREVGDIWTEAYASGNLALWLIHCDRSGEAHEPVASTERLAKMQGDAMLLGLAGLARGWLHLAENQLEQSLAVLEPARTLGADTHQHHFIGMYIGLARFRQGDYLHAAIEWHEALRNAIAVGHLRGMAGSVEGCAYIAERLGHAEEACRYLSSAHQVRERSGSPLFSFWCRHNAEAHASLRSQLGLQRYQAALAAGARTPTEDIVNSAARLLRECGQIPESLNDPLVASGRGRQGHSAGAVP